MQLLKFYTRDNKALTFLPRGESIFLIKATNDSSLSPFTK